MSGFPDQVAGFDRPQAASDAYVADLYAQHDLGDAPSLAHIEPIATELLSNPDTVLSGMSLVLGRHVDATELAEDPELGAAMQFAEPGQKFGLLLLKRAFDPREQTNE